MLVCSTNIFYIKLIFIKVNWIKKAFMEQTKVTDIMTNEDVFVGYEDVFENAMIKLHDFPVLAVVGGREVPWISYPL